MASYNAQIFLGNIIHCKSRTELEILENGFIIVIGAKILAIGGEPELIDAISRLHLDTKNTPRVILSDSQFLIPGFVDCHLHAPQYPNCGLGYDKSLLDWLNIYTYPLEMKYTDLEYSHKVYDALVKKTLNCGTTTACYYGSLYKDSCNVLVETVIDHGQRALIGKVNMTKNAPEGYYESPETSIVNTLEFIKYVQSRKTDLVKPIITPRFALSVDMDHMIDLSSIAKCQDLHIQTHISETTEEVDQVQTQYGMHYADVYDKAHLLTPKTILAHAIYLTEPEIKLIARRGCSIAHCPDSNLCLKSGACNVKQLWNFGIPVGLGSDIAGGTHPSILKVMKLCLYSSVHFSFMLKDYTPLNYEEVFYLGTLGGSEALSLQKEIGNFEVNKDFDAMIVDMAAEYGIDYLRECTPRDLLQKFIYCGDDRNIQTVYVAGKLVKYHNKIIDAQADSFESIDED